MSHNSSRKPSKSDDLNASTLEPREESSGRSRGKEPPVPRDAGIKVIPEERSHRIMIRAEAARVTKSLDRRSPPQRQELEKLAASILARLGLDGRGYVGFTMVCVHNEFWRDQLAGIPYCRRLLLLPHCLKNRNVCQAEYDAAGLNCINCGACLISRFKTRAEKLGYKVLVAEGTPIVLKIILSHDVDGLVGVSCLSTLEKAIDRVLQMGIPAMAVPLLSSSCLDSEVDQDWVYELIGLRAKPPPELTRTYLPLLRAANEMFSRENLRRLVPGKLRGIHPLAETGDSSEAWESPLTSVDPLGCVEATAIDFLLRGGKRCRPFITLAGYDALAQGNGTKPREGSALPDIPLPVQRAAAAMEIFHKASLVHDDIEDDDAFRYGRPSLHKEHGIPFALNVGDYLIGLGYQMISQEADAIGAGCTADLLQQLSSAHLKLCRGQGAELLWREKRDVPISPLEALKIYALKTVPAFEAALYSGIRIAGHNPDHTRIIHDFSRNLGIAYQVRNDLKDWEKDDDNKLFVGLDVLSARPTLLLALALEAAVTRDRDFILNTIRGPVEDSSILYEVHRVFQRCGVFHKAEALIAKYKTRAKKIADAAEPYLLKCLLHFLVDALLDTDDPDYPYPATTSPFANFSFLAGPSSRE